MASEAAASDAYASSGMWGGVRGGSVSDVQNSITRGLDVNCLAADGSNPLHLAAMQGSREVCEVLIAAGANVHALNSRGFTPLHNAAQHNRLEVCTVLFEARADVNLLAGVDYTPFILAAMYGRRALCCMLVAAGAHVNAATDTTRMAPLLTAALQGYADVCESLASGASVHAQAVDDSTPLQTISRSDDAELFSLRRLLVAYGAPVAELPAGASAVQLPKYCAAVRTGARVRRVAALSAWVHWQDAADGVPTLAARETAAAGSHAVLPLSVCVSCELLVLPIQELLRCSRCEGGGYCSAACQGRSS